VTRLRNSITLLALGLVAAPAALYGQSNTTSALAGTIRDHTGAPVAGAIIRVSSPSLIGGERTTYAAANGAYRIPGLPPGKYRIVVEAKGHSPVSGNETLALGLTSTVNWKFPAPNAAVVEVLASETQVDATPLGLTQNFSTDDLANLPVDRQISSIMALTPGVNSNQAWGGSTGENAYLMDGMNIGDPSGGSQWLYANPDWFSEVQVGGIGAPAEYGNFNGAYTNALVKRGGNDFAGSFNFYYADTKWQAKTSNRYPGLDRSILPGKDFDGALNVGGPIIKDKLWFFASAWARQEEDTPIGALAKDKRSYQNYLAKFTWQATKEATLELLLEYDSLPETNRGIDSTEQVVAAHNQVAPDRMFSLAWTQTLSPSVVLTAKSSGYSGNYENRPNNGSAPSLNAEGTLTTTILDNFNNNPWYRNNYRSRIEGVVTLDVFSTNLLTPGDTHAFKFGIEQAQASNEDTKIPTGGAQLYGYEDDVPGMLYPDYFDMGGGYAIKVHANRSCAYAQDNWTVNSFLNLRAGLRYERYTARGYGRSTIWDQKAFAPRLGGSVAFDKEQHDVLKFHWGRYYEGFSSYFIDRSYQEWIPKTYEYAWSAGPSNPFNPFDPTSYPVANPDPANLMSVTNSIAPVSSGAKQPYTDETTLAFEHRFDSGWTASATWVYREQKNILVHKDVADVLTGPNATGAWVTDTWYYQGDDSQPGHDFSWWNTKVDPANVDGNKYIVTSEPSAKRNYVSGSLVVDRKWKDGWSLNASFTRARLYGNIRSADGYDSWGTYEDPNSAVNSNGLLTGYHDYEFKVHGAVQLPWTLKLSGNFTYLSGERFTPYVRTARNNFSVRQYVFIGPRGSAQYPAEHLLDLRLSKDFKFQAQTNLEVFAQVFNVLNAGSTLSYASERINSTSFGVPSSVETGRRLQLGLRCSF
jgi:hypothetical protein